MDPLHIGESIAAEITKQVDARISGIVSAAVDGALKQIPVVDDLLNGRRVTFVIDPIEVPPITIQLKRNA